ncbi:MAG TPA: DNA-processing protein DprA [Fimbriimonas sp.]|nr:DNA-processing protein DprA [Fimbriimonas sp.]
MAALYLRGLGGGVYVARQSWPFVVRTLRTASVPLGQTAKALRSAGQLDAALRLDEPGLLSAAESVVEKSLCLTLFDPGFPVRWIKSMGDGAPPVLWCVGEPPLGETACVVGSREVSRGVWSFASGAGRAVARAKMILVSGGAKGCDTAAEQGALRAGGSVIRILPYGLGGQRPLERRLLLSVCPPNEPFSTASAMERNALLYASADRSLVASCRFGEGGTWHGAVTALRRRSSQLFVRSGGRGEAALAALGAIAVDTADQFLTEPLPLRAQPSLALGSGRPSFFF